MLDAAVLSTSSSSKHRTQGPAAETPCFGGSLESALLATPLTSFSAVFLPQIRV